MDMQNQTPASAAFADELRQKAEAHGAVQIDLQTILFQQGRAIARAYVDMMKSYAKLTAQAGRYVREENRMIVSGFCRVEEEHFEHGSLLQIKKSHRNPLTARLSEMGQLTQYAVSMHESNLFLAFCTSFSEFCAAEGIRTGSLSVLVRKKDGSTEQRALPAVLTGAEHIEAIGFPYQIEF